VQSLYSEELKQIIGELSALQIEGGKSDQEFARDHLDYSSTVWFRLKQGTYETKDFEKITLQFSRNLRALREEIALSHKGVAAVFHKLKHFEAALKAVKECRTMKNENRLVVYLAETGGGKTTLCKQVRKECNAITVQARESWRKSYFAACSDIAAAAGAKGAWASEHQAEESMLKALLAKRQVLVIDEGEYFGPRTINLLKLILNETETVILLCSIPDLYERWNRASWIESQQLKRRTHAVIQCDMIRPDDVRKFASDIHFDNNATVSLAMISRAANAFGRYDFIRRVIEELDSSSAIDMAETEKAIQRVNAAIRKN
jgi:hypothetical protein